MAHHAAVRGPPLLHGHPTVHGAGGAGAAGPAPAHPTVLGHVVLGFDAAAAVLGCVVQDDPTVLEHCVRGVRGPGADGAAAAAAAAAVGDVLPRHSN